MEKLPGMVSPGEQHSVKQEIDRLAGAVDELMEALRAQREILRQRGMGLPPGTLPGLKSIRADLDQINTQLATDAVELEQLRALAHTTELVNSSLDINEVLREVMDTVIQLVGAERGYIVLRDEHTGQMEFRIARNIDRQSINQGDFIISRTIVDDVAQTGDPVLTTNAQADERYSAQESVVLHALRSILCVPLTVKGQVTGVVYSDNRIKDGLFGEKELSLLVNFANQAAIAIENARLFERV
ncbi:MAG: GAF domain-containing protein, partial [Anaerolineae bacterium]|nr:GAF domain-containing protein [Anaerolineae bacterium]